MSRLWNVAVAGATGAVGNQMIRCLEERNFPVKKLKLLASARSVGKTLPFRGQPIAVEELTEDSFKGVEIALFSAGASTSLKFAPAAVKAGCVVVDNSSAYRMDPQIPLVVPEVNPHRIVSTPGHYRQPELFDHPDGGGLEADPRPVPDHDGSWCPLIRRCPERGKRRSLNCRTRLRTCWTGKAPEIKVYPYQIAYNCLPHIDVFLENDYTKEEMKMVHETRKILEDDSIRVAATAVRVPVYYGHSEAIHVETEEKITPQEVRDLLREAPGVVVVDDVAAKKYPLPFMAAGRDEVFVGRIREDISTEKGIVLWVVSDNIRKGAATNAVQIAERVIELK